MRFAAVRAVRAVRAVGAVGAVFGVALVLATAACGEHVPGPPSDAKASEARFPTVDSETVSTSPRGLAAAIIEHVDASKVTDLGGAGSGGTIHASVGLTDSDIESLFVVVASDRMLAIQDCGVDFGYRVVECRNAPSLRELVVARRLECEGPTLMGRFDDDARGIVLIELFGADTPSNRRLVAELLDDPLVGMTTSAAAEAAGQDLDFGKSQLTTELKIDTGGGSLC